jgi:hypothetical protein
MFMADSENGFAEEMDCASGFDSFVADRRSGWCCGCVWEVKDLKYSP